MHIAESVTTVDALEPLDTHMRVNMSPQVSPLRKGLVAACEMAMKLALLAVRPQVVEKLTEVLEALPACELIVRVVALNQSKYFTKLGASRRRVDHEELEVTALRYRGCKVCVLWPKVFPVDCQ